MSILGQLQLRRDTAANWAASNPILLAGEIGLESDTDKFKVGNGMAAWSARPYGGIVGPQGTQGPQGIQGTQGVQGPQGIQGTQGVPGTSGVSVAVSDEGAALTGAAASINFVGGGVTATTSGSAVTVTIPPDAVSSVFGRAGAVTAQQADYDAFFTTPAEAAAAAPVQSVNGATGAVVIPTPRATIPAPAITNPTTVAETVVARWAIPANFIALNQAFSINVGFQSGAAGTVTWRVRVGAAGTVADTQVMATTASAAQVANAYGFFNAALMANTATTIGGNGFAVMQAVPLGTPTAAITRATIAPTATVFISVTMVVSVASAANIIVAADLNVGG